MKSDNPHECLYLKVMIFTTRDFLVTRSHFFLILSVALLFTALQTHRPTFAQKVEPDPRALADAGRQTLEHLENGSATWVTEIELPNGSIASVDVISAPLMRRIDLYLHAGQEKQRFVRIIERDGFWYVTDQAGRFKYKPYEAPLLFSAFYVFIERSQPRAFVDTAQSFGKFARLQGNAAVYRADLPPETKQQIQATLNNLLELEKAQAGAANPKLAELKQKLQRTLRDGSEVVINIKTGIIEQYGFQGKRNWIKQFRRLESIDEQDFDVQGQVWEDRSGSIIPEQGDPSDVILIGHAKAWRPGQQTMDTDLLLMNLADGQLRRVAYQLGVAAGGCLSSDRSYAYISGQMLDAGGIGVFEINLKTGDHRQLGGKELLSGITMFPTLSHDGRTLAALHMTPEHGQLHSQVYLIDIETGESKKLGKPIDTAFLSWLPDDQGLILISREYEDVNQPSIGTICRMNLKGQLTEIRKGDHPLLLDDSRILFEDPGDRLWKTCDLQGGSVKLIGDGLKSHGFPTVSPDGKQLIMMRFDPATGPQPYLIDVETGETKMISVGAGLWAMPRWR